MIFTVVLILDTKNEHYGEDHFLSASTLYNLGLVHDALAERKRANQLFRGALAIQTRVLGPDHVSTRQSERAVEATQ